LNLDINDTILIVTGSELTPELKDRPLAYRLKETIDPFGKNQYQQAIVVSDRWYLENEILQICATLLVGGPGVNAATSELFDKLPMHWAFNEQAFIQWLRESETKAAIWGMNQASTTQAVDFFIQEFLDEFLDIAWNLYDTK